MRTIRVRRHVRTINGRVCEIPAHWRHIGDAEPDAAPVQRDELTMDLFDEIETIRALGSMPDGAVITGALLMAARQEWRK